MQSIFGDIERTKYVYRSDANDTLELLESSRISRSRSKKSTAIDNDAQFRLFVLEDCGEGKSAFLDPGQSTAKIGGSLEAPDVRMRIELLAFHPGDLEIDQNHSRATLRLDIGQGSLNSSSLDPLFWSIAAGLDLASAAGLVTSDKPRKYRDDFSRSFANRPIELPGGGAQIRFQVISHPKEKWWQDIFRFAKSDVGDRLISSLGFPGITREAIKIIDQAVGLLNAPSVIFQSDKMDFALSEFARQDFTMGMPNIEIGVINPGFCLLAPQGKFDLITQLKPKYLATYGRLVPGDWDYSDYHLKEENPLEAVPYAVLKVRSEACSLRGNL